MDGFSAFRTPSAENAGGLYAGQSGSAVNDTDDSGIHRGILEITADSRGASGGNEYDFSDTGADVIDRNESFTLAVHHGKGFDNHKFTADQIFIFTSGNNASDHFSD